jgi:hypothetical protein
MEFRESFDQGKARLLQMLEGYMTDAEALKDQVDRHLATLPRTVDRSVAYTYHGYFQINNYYRDESIFDSTVKDLYSRNKGPML